LGKPSEFDPPTTSRIPTPGTGFSLVRKP
jgi:hypothetical protein